MTAGVFAYPIHTGTEIEGSGENSLATFIPGSATVVGRFTVWRSALQPGDFILAGGAVNVVKQIVDDETLTLALPWTGPEITEGPYVAQRWMQHTDGRWIGTAITEYFATLERVPADIQDMLDLSLEYRNAAAVSAQLAENYATKTDGEVEPGQGYGAKKYAQDAAASNTAAGNAKTASEAARDLSQKWAEGADDTDVNGAGTRSARHHARQAAGSATAAAGSASAANTSAGAASGSAQLAADWAEKANDTDVAGAGTRSSKHWANKAAASAAAAATFDPALYAKADLSNTTGPRGPSPLLTAADFDTLTNNGLYAMSPGNANAPDPALHFVLRVERYSDPGYVTQYARGFTSDTPTDSKLWKRDQNNGIWSAWIRVRENEAEIASAFGPFSWRNRIFNGDMRVSQRGTYFDTPASGSYTLDRWMVAYDGTGAFAVSQNPTAADASVRSELYWNQSQAPVGCTFRQLVQRIAGVNAFAGKRVVVSFVLKNVANAPAIGVSLGQVFGTGGSPSATVFSNPVSSSIKQDGSRSWAIFDVPSLAGKVKGTAGNDYLALIFTLPTTGVWGFTLNEVQIEEGSTPTPFEVRPYNVELALCRHYFRRIAPGAAGVRLVTGFASTATQSVYGLDLGEPMRITPIMSVSAVGDWTVVQQQTTLTATTMTLSTSSPTHLTLVADVASGFTAGSPVQLRAGNANATLNLSAEL